MAIVKRDPRFEPSSMQCDLDRRCGARLNDEQHDDS